MKKILIVSLLVLMLSGCSFSKVWKWLDEMDYERDDRTIRSIEIFIR